MTWWFASIHREAFGPKARITCPIELSARRFSLENYIWELRSPENDSDLPDKRASYPA